MVAWHSIGNGDGSITEIDQGYGIVATPNPITTTGIIGLDLNAINERASCRLLMDTTDISATYNNGSSGVGATLTNNVNGSLTIDGVSAVVGDRVLPFNFFPGYKNGIYVVTDVGSSSTPWILTRASDFDGSISGGIRKGVWVWITSGSSSNANTIWIQTREGPFTVGTTTISFIGYEGQADIIKLGIVTTGTWRADNVEVVHGGSGNSSATAYGLICGGTISTGNFQSVSPAAVGKILQAQGTSSLPAWTSSTYPSSITANQLLYGSSSNVVGQLTSSNNSILKTDSSGVPSFSATLPIAVQSNIAQVGTVSFGTWNADVVTAPYGGTGRASFTPNALITGGTTSTGSLQVLATGLSGQILTSNGSASIPSWSAPVNQTITLTGDITGSGTSSIATTLASTISRSSNQTFSFSSGGMVISSNLSVGGAAVSGFGSPVIQMQGNDSAAAGPHLQAFTNTDVYPLLQLLNYSHNNVSINFDAYYDGSWRSSYLNSNFQIYKISNQLQFNYSPGAIHGNTITWSNGILMDTSGNVTLPNGDLKISSGTAYLNRVPSGWMYMEGNGTATTITTGGNYYKIDGTTTSGSLNKFDMPANNRIRYIGTPNITASVIVSTSSGPSQPSLVSIRIYKNGSAITGTTSSYQYTLFSIGGLVLSLSTGTIVPLSTNDYLEIYISGDVNGQTVQVVDMQVLVKAT